MTVFEQLSAQNSVAMAVAAALEQAIGPDTILTVGLPRTTAPDETLLPPNARLGVVGLADGVTGQIAIAVTEPVAHALEAGAPDEELLTALAPAFAAAIGEIARVGPGTAAAGPAAAPSAAEYQHSLPSDGSFLVYPLLDGTERVGALVVHVANDAAPGASLPHDEDDAASTAAPAHTRHEFETLPEPAGISLVDPRPLSLLHDVEMGVTAELGRRRMTVRDLLSLTPGAVIELDRAAGSPVDVLVNGTLIARGEVVVIDEEFGIRVSEIVAGVETGVR
jgi:flagellar motor switch protein FliN/FliY